MKKLLLSIIGITAFLIANSQTPDITSPVILGISYNADNNQYSMSWNSVTGAEKYIICTYDRPTNGGKDPFYKEIDTVLAPLTFYNFHSDTIIYFAVKTMIGSFKSDGDYKWPSEATCNVILKSSYDSCKNELTLSWNPNNAYKNPKYTIKRFKDNIKTIDSTSYTFKSKELNNLLTLGGLGEFYIYINDITNDKFVSLSDTVKFTQPKGATRPKYIEATGTKIWDTPTGGVWTLDAMIAAQNTNKISLSFAVDPASDLKKLVIYRSSNNQISFERLNPEGAEAFGSYPDETVDSVSSKTYYYKATVLSTCNEPIPEVIISNIESNITLTAQKVEGGSILLTWNEYTKFNGNVKYDLYRVRAGIGEKFITSTKEHSFVDKLTDLEDKENVELFCYYVQAVEENNPNNANGLSVSNLACKELSVVDQITMPKYLTLGADCKSRAANPFIFPVDVTTPKKYLMAIFDRWGTKVFETENIAEGWDGTLSNGSIAPQGGYVYYIKFTSKTGPAAEKRGTVVVLCP